MHVIHCMNIYLKLLRMPDEIYFMLISAVNKQ